MTVHVFTIVNRKQSVVKKKRTHVRLRFTGNSELFVRHEYTSECIHDASSRGRV